MIKGIKNNIIDDEARYCLQMITIPIALSAVSFGMFLLNIVTNKTGLVYATLIFGISSLIQTWITIKNRNNHILHFCLLSMNILILFIYFILYGGTEGFSPIWICMLPSFAPFVLGKKKGSLLCGLMFIIIVFLLWTPSGRSILQYEYTQSFIMRFPIMYISCFLIGYILEYIRKATYDSLVELEGLYRNQSEKDTLTQLYNRYYFDDSLGKIIGSSKNQQISLLMLDVDFFKGINDKYGHLVGDEVLKEVAKVMMGCKKEDSIIARWGGEEFAIIIKNCDGEKAYIYAEDIRKNIENNKISAGNYKNLMVTISIGVVSSLIDESVTLDYLVSCADKALYNAKDSGRNCVKIYTK